MNVQDEKLPLGFTFSFPCQQVGLTRGLLIKWSKGFNCEGVVGRNVVELLEEAIERRNVMKT
jgi:hexokinase